MRPFETFRCYCDGSSIAWPELYLWDHFELLRDNLFLRIFFRNAGGLCILKFLSCSKTWYWLTPRIELTNQAENLGLVNVVKLKSKQVTSTPASKADADSVIQTNDVSSTSSTQDAFSTSSSRSSISGEESGLDEMSSTGSSSGTNGHVCSQSLSVSSSSFSSSDSEGDSISSTTKNNHQRFVSSFKIKLGQQNINTDEISWRKE